MFRSAHWFRLLVVFLVTLASIGTDAEARPVRIMPLGDSITYGEGGAGGFGGYRGSLYYRLLNAGYSFDFVGTQTSNSGSVPDRNHEGHGGWRIDQIHANINGWINAVGCPDIVLLHIGTNDFGQWVDTLNAIKRLDALISRMTTKCPEAHIIVTTLLPTFPAQYSAFKTQFNPFVEEVVDAHIAAGRFVSSLDMHAVVPYSQLSDGLHPNATGYASMAGAWFEAIEEIIEPDCAVPPAIEEVRGNEAGDQVVITFNRRLDQGAAENIANYSIDHGLAVHAAELSGYARVVTLTTDPQSLGTSYGLTVNGLSDRVSPTPNTIAANTTATFFRPTPQGYYNHVDEAACYTLVQSLEIPAAPDFSTAPVPYSLDFSGRVGPFDRVAYYLELKAPGSDLQYVWASMDAFTMDPALLGVPAAGTGAVFQQSVTGLNFVSNLSAVGSGTGRQGNLEFWPSDSGAANAGAVPGASGSLFDFGDSNPATGNYGSMQVHDTGGGQTLIAFNRWGGVGGDADIGIGNRLAGEPDWTFAQNAAGFEVRKLQVLVRTSNDTTPPVLVSAASDHSRSEITVRFDEAVRRDTLIPANFSLDEDVRVLGMRFGEDLHEVVLQTTPQPAAGLTLTVIHVRDSSPGANQIAPGSAVAVSAPLLPAEVLANIGSAADGYELAYTLEIPTAGNLNASTPYLVDNSAVSGAFSKVAYYLELQQAGGPLQYIWASMDAFTSSRGEIGVPTFASGARHQGAVTDLEVISDVPSIVSGSGLSGHIEFWPTGYARANAANVAGASSSTYDFGDQRLPDGSWGSMQIHHPATSQTLFALNGWGSTNTGAFDLGIGNGPSSDPDWTGAQNAGDYSRRVLHVMTLPAYPVPVPAEVLAKVPESADYDLVYSLDIPANGNLSGGSGFTPYSVDRSGEGGTFSRIAYYLELQKSGELEPTFAWVSMEAFTDDRGKIGVPNQSSGAVFQQFVSDLNIVSNSGITTGFGLEGNLEFWPNGYATNNTLPVPGASGAVYDFGDQPAAGDYGSMQVHNPVARETIFAINHWGTTGSTTNPLCVGIGPNPAPINGATDYTFADNAASFDLVRKLHVLVLPGDPPASAPQFVETYASAQGDRLSVTFDRELSDASAHPSQFSIDGGLQVTGARMQAGNRTIVLTTTPQTPGETYTLQAEGVTARSPAGARMLPGASIPFTAYSPPPVFANIPELGLELIYELELPATSPGWNFNPIPYSIDETRFGEHSFDRVAYLLQLDDNWLFVSFDAHTDELGQIGVPTFAVTATPFQQEVTNMNVASNVAGIVTGEGIGTGNIEFWSGGYQPASSTSVPNASASTYDFGDHMIAGSAYGTMQVHNYGASQTLFAYNEWAANSGTGSEVGIGNNTGGAHPDWTSSDSASDWSSRKLFVFARRDGGGDAPVILSNPCDRTVDAGGDVTFAVTLRGDGPFTYQWHRDGIALPGQTQPWLELSSVTADDAAAYQVTVTGPDLSSVMSPVASLTINPLSPIEAWRQLHRLTESDGDLDDCDGDGLANLIEFAFGSDPKHSDHQPLAPDGTTNGTPVLVAGSGSTFDAVFLRRKDHGQPGSLGYTVEFSPDLRSFHASLATPTVVVESVADPAYQLVKVPFPTTTPEGHPARYFRVRVQLLP